MAIVVALAVLALAFGGSVVAVGAAAVDPLAWAVLFLACALACVLALRASAPKVAPAVWLYLAGCATLVAGIFYGANIGLDALHGATRPKANVAASLGGLELWFVFFPGLASVAMACSAGTYAAGRRTRP